MVACKHYFNPNCKCALEALIVYSVFIPKMNKSPELKMTYVYLLRKKYLYR